MRAALVLVLILFAAPALAAADVTTVRYVGTPTPNVGGICTSGSTQDRNQTPTDAPLVVGGVCNVPMRNATTIDVSIVDDFAGAMAFRYQFNGTAPCASQSGAGVGALSGVIVPTGCFRVSVYVGSGGTTGVITVGRN